MHYFFYIIILFFLILYMSSKNEVSNKIKLRIIFWYLLLYPFLLTLFELINNSMDSSYEIGQSYLESIIINFKYQLLIILIGALVLFIKSKQIKKQPPVNWNNFREYILDNKGLSIALSILIIAIGMIGAGIVNFLSSDTTQSILSAFNVGSITFLLLLAIGLFLISPLIDFKMKYSFLENYEVENAKVVLNTYKRASSLRTSTKGLISIQLFEIQETTDDSEIIFEYKQLWFSKNPKSTVNKLKKSEIGVPLSIWSFLDGLNHNKTFDYNFLNQFTISKSEQKESGYIKKYIDPMFLLALHDYLKETFYLQTVESRYLDEINTSYKNESILKSLTEEQSEEIEDAFQKWIKGWDIPLEIFSKPKYSSYKSIHYVSFFNLIKAPYFLNLNDFSEKPKPLMLDDVINEHSKPFTLKSDIENKLNLISNGEKKKITLWEELTTEDDLSNYIYKGFYDGEKDEKSQRCYYNFLLKTSSIEEGQKNFIILMVCDNRFIPKIENASSLFKIMIK
ncbi:hypothetical protein [Planococcus rifietoensis]|uniref:hypothetical protein n=1 Tax=Planococcus rifietoensis TaxID=200991 RepID=UPI00384AE7BF